MGRAGEFEFDESGMAEMMHAVRGEVMEPLLDEIQHDARRHAPREDGELAASIEIDVESDLSGFVGSNLEYAAAQEMGARPHAIPGAWGSPATPHERDPRYHPGNKPQPYLRPALYKRRSE